jgi:hypothetical protein
VVEELTGYTSADIEDIFVRVNRYVIALNAQELRKAKERGAFAEFVEAIGKWDWWKTNRIFTNTQVERMRPVEFAAELVILLGEGPQDKKASINIWYAKYRDTFPEARDMERRLQRYLDWLTKALPHIAETRFRKPVDLYSLIGALDAVSSQGETLAKLSAQAGGKALKDFDRKTKLTRPPVEVQRYILAASRQTDNLIPRQSRIDVIEELLKGV